MNQCQKRPPRVSKDTYYSVKRDLLQCQKRPTTVSKETYYSVKRDLLHTDLFRVEEGVIEGVNFFFPCNVEKQKNKRRHESQDTDRPLRNRRGCYRAPPFSEVCQGTADIWHCTKQNKKKKRLFSSASFFSSTSRYGRYVAARMIFWKVSALVQVYYMGTTSVLYEGTIRGYSWQFFLSACARARSRRYSQE